MKTIHKSLFLALGSIAYLLLWYFLSSFGNEYSHPIINEQMVEAFKKDLNYQSTVAKFKNVTFHFDETLPGVDVKKGATEMSVRDWIKRGGYSADIPELYNSFRHFYDPTEPDGNRYYKDNPKGILGYLQDFYPYQDAIDGVEWAVAHADHEYRWLQGKVWVRQAFATKDEAQRKLLMGKAWRAFGETLHMLADNATPAHVRNDAHPAKWGQAENKYLGDPDTFEEYLDHIGKNDNARFVQFASQKAEAGVTANLKKATTIRELAHSMATYTNTNFFSGQTFLGTDIVGNSIKHTNNIKKTYPSPSINPKLWEDGYYIKDGVKLCNQPWWVGIVENAGEVVIDRPTVEAQAALLIPAAVEAGRNAFRLFVPDISVSINTFDIEGNIQGTVTHKKDAEYTLPISYNGPLYILNKKYDRIATIEVKDGVFEGILENPQDPDLEEIRATISLGGISFLSDPTRKVKVIEGSISVRGVFELKRVVKTKTSETDEGGTYYFPMGGQLSPGTVEEKNGVVTGKVWIYSLEVTAPNSNFRVEYDPKTFEIKSFSYGYEFDFGQGTYQTESIKGGNIPAKFFKVNRMLSDNRVDYVWEVSGADVTKYLQEAKFYAKSTNAILMSTEERWFDKLVVSDKTVLEIRLRYGTN